MADQNNTLNTDVLPYPVPSWIYEGADDSKYEKGTGVVLNRAPKQIQENVLKLKSISDLKINALNLFNPPEFNIKNKYKYLDIVKDDLDRIYLCINKNGSTKKDVEDSSYWSQLLVGNIYDIDGGEF